MPIKLNFPDTVKSIAEKFQSPPDMSDVFSRPQAQPVSIYVANRVLSNSPYGELLSLAHMVTTIALGVFHLSGQISGQRNHSFQARRELHSSFNELEQSDQTRYTDLKNEVETLLSTVEREALICSHINRLTILSCITIAAAGALQAQMVVIAALVFLVALDTFGAYRQGSGAATQEITSKAQNILTQLEQPIAPLEPGEEEGA